MKKCLSKVFNQTILLLPILLISFTSQAVVISNREDIGVPIDKITKKSKGDWSCWETHPTPELSLFEGSYCGVLKIAANADTGEDGYVGVIRAQNKGLSTIGRYVIGLNTKDHLYWIAGVTITYDNHAAGSYQLELIDEDWEYISIANQSEEKCGNQYDPIVPENCALTSVIPTHDRAKYYRTERNIYTRMVVFGSKKSSSSMVLNQLEALVYWAGPRR